MKLPHEPLDVCIVAAASSLARLQIEQRSAWLKQTDSTDRPRPNAAG